MTNVEFLQAVRAEMAIHANHGHNVDSVCISSERRAKLEMFRDVFYPESIKFEPATLCGLKVCVSDDLTENEFFIGKIPPQPKPNETAKVVRCKDCVYYKSEKLLRVDGSDYFTCPANGGLFGPDDFCSSGERSEI